MDLDAIFAGIRESIANARPDVRREQGDLLTQLDGAVGERAVEKSIAILERLDIIDHYPVGRRPDGTLEPQPMPGGWTSWYGWMAQLKAWEGDDYRRRQGALAVGDIPDSEFKRTIW